MYKNILVTTDGSEFSERAFGHAADLAKLLGARLTAVTVTPPIQFIAIEGVVYPEDPEKHKEMTEAQAKAALDVVAKAAQARGVACELVQLENPQPYEGIIATAKDKGCDLIVMASHGRRGISAFLLGSETQKVLTHSTIPVLVYR
ncbi:MAG: universal stress protein [Hyphomicrobiaceae bacterium]|nr:universal stress protein [Hyphomicrobiaceae bacterium]